METERLDNKTSIAIAGIQKLTLLDYPSITACTIFTAGCNFACPFCHNQALIPFAGRGSGSADDVKLLTEDYLFDFLKSRCGLLDGVCISGGEPLAQEGIFDFTREIKKLGFLVKIDTNGSYPGRLARLVETESIDYVAMDIKNSPSMYPQTIGKPDYDIKPVLESIKYLLEGKVAYEFRTTIVREFHTEAELISIANMIKGAGRYYIQCYKFRDDMKQNNLSSYNTQELQALYEKVREILPFAELRGV